MRLLDIFSGKWLPWKSHNGSAGVFASAISSTSVTPNDATSITCKALYIGTDGTLVIKHTSTDSAVSYVGVLAGTIVPVSLEDGRVMAATTATNIVAMDW